MSRSAVLLWVLMAAIILSLANKFMVCQWVLLQADPLVQFMEPADYKHNVLELKMEKSTGRPRMNLNATACPDHNEFSLKEKRSRKRLMKILGLFNVFRIGSARQWQFNDGMFPFTTRQFAFQEPRCWGDRQ